MSARIVEGTAQMYDPEVYASLEEFVATAQVAGGDFTGGTFYWLSDPHATYVVTGGTIHIIDYVDATAPVSVVSLPCASLDTNVPEEITPWVEANLQVHATGLATIPAGNGGSYVSGALAGLLAQEPDGEIAPGRVVFAVVESGGGVANVRVRLEVDALP